MCAISVPLILKSIKITLIWDITVLMSMISFEENIIQVPYDYLEPTFSYPLFSLMALSIVLAKLWFTIPLTQYISWNCKIPCYVGYSFLCPCLGVDSAIGSYHSYPKHSCHCRIQVVSWKCLLTLRVLPTPYLHYFNVREISTKESQQTNT